MMKNLLLVLLLPVYMLACSQGGEVEVTFNISNKKSSKINLNVLDENYNLNLDESGRAVEKIYVPKKTYAHVYYNHRAFTIYLTPGKNIDISFDVNDRSKRIFLYCDDKGISNYMAKERHVSYNLERNIYHLNEKSYIKFLEDNINKKREYLISKKLPADFTDLEKERIAYNVIDEIFYYPVYRRFFTKNKKYKASEDFNDFIDSMFVQRPELLDLRPYKNFLIRYVENKALEKRTSVLNLSRVSKEVEYVLKNIESTQISDFLLDKFVYPFIKEKGIEGNEILISAYNKNIKNSEYKKKFNKLVERYRALEKGKPAPVFSFRDINGNLVSLKDFRGKYVYIRVWATWDYSFKRTLGYYNSLMDKYRGKNIFFVNISIDDDYEKWKEYVETRKVGGIKLFSGHDHSFTDSYVIGQLPRYILIDKEGNIYDANISKHSSKNMIHELDNLPGI